MTLKEKKNLQKQAVLAANRQSELAYRERSIKRRQSSVINFAVEQIDEDFADNSTATKSPIERQVLGCNGHQVTLKRGAKHASSGQSHKSKQERLANINIHDPFNHIRYKHVEPNVIINESGLVSFDKRIEKPLATVIRGGEIVLPLPAKYKGKKTSTQTYIRLCR